jgi:hypothetical protein
MTVLERSVFEIANQFAPSLAALGALRLAGLFGLLLLGDEPPKGTDRRVPGDGLAAVSATT